MTDDIVGIHTFVECSDRDTWLLYDHLEVMCSRFNSALSCDHVVRSKRCPKGYQ
jgi:hypothetical protein